MSLWNYHKNGPFVLNVADKFCLFSKNIRKSQIFLILAKICVIFTFSQANFSYYFHENAKAKFFVSSLPLTVYLLATVSFVAVAVVLAFVNILNSSNRFLIGLLYVRIPASFTNNVVPIFMRRSWSRQIRTTKAGSVNDCGVNFSILQGKTGQYYWCQHWKSERCCGKAESKLHCFFLLYAVFIYNFFRVLFLKSSLNAELSHYKLH